jgi:hypothetical protein
VKLGGPAYDGLVELALILCRSLSFTSGLLLLYAGLFLYEDEEGQVQSVLEKWWVQIDDTRQHALSRHTKFLNVVGFVATRLLDRVLGPRTLSLRGVTVVGCLSLMSLVAYSWLMRGAIWLMTVSGVARVDGRDHPYLIKALKTGIFAFAMSGSLLTPRFYGLLCFGCAAAIAIVAQARSARLTWLPGLVMVTFVAIVWRTTPYNKVQAELLLTTIIALVVGVIFDVMALGGARILLRRQWLTASFTTAAVAALLQIVIGMVLLALPFQFGRGIEWLYSFCSRAVVTGMWASVSTNLFSAALTLLGTAFALSMIAHRLVWPIIGRACYRLARLNVLTSPVSRGLLLALACGLITLASDDVGRILRRIAALFWTA